MKINQHVVTRGRNVPIGSFIHDPFSLLLISAAIKPY